MLLNIYFCIQCEIFTHTSQINIYPLSVIASIYLIHHQKMLLHNVELGYDITVGPFMGANIGVNRHFGERTTTQMRMILHLHPTF